MPRAVWLAISPADYRLGLAELGPLATILGHDPWPQFCCCPVQAGDPKWGAGLGELVWSKAWQKPGSRRGDPGSSTIRDCATTAARPDSSDSGSRSRRRS